MDDFSVEIKSIDTRYESYRLPDPERERDLLDSIVSSGIQYPLSGVRKGKFLYST